MRNAALPNIFLPCTTKLIDRMLNTLLASSAIDISQCISAKSNISLTKNLKELNNVNAGDKLTIRDL